LSPIRGYVFDAYGTLFDVHSVVEAGREITGDPVALSTLWRQKQLEYTWLRSLMGTYADFWAVTEAALRYSIRRLGLSANDAQVRRLMDAYLSLACFPEVKTALGRLAGRSARFSRTARRSCWPRPSPLAGSARCSTTSSRSTA